MKNIKKNFSILLLLTLSIFCELKAQSATPTTEQKISINPIIDDAFNDWGSSWSYDTYINRSAKIETINIDENYGDVSVRGTFGYKRLGKEYYGDFTCNFIFRNGNYKIQKLSYVDHTGIKDSKKF